MGRGTVAVIVNLSKINFFPFQPWSQRCINFFVLAPGSEKASAGTYGSRRAAARRSQWSGQATKIIFEFFDFSFGISNFSCPFVQETGKNFNHSKELIWKTWGPRAMYSQEKLEVQVSNVAGFCF